MEVLPALLGLELNPSLIILGECVPAQTPARLIPGAAVVVPPDPAETSLFSKGGEVMKLHIEGSLTIPTTGN